MTTPSGQAMAKPRLLVLASTYPRWTNDPEPGFVHELAKRMTGDFDVTVLCPHAPGANVREKLDGVEVFRYRYAPEKLETLVNDGGIVTNLKQAKWKLLLVPGFVLMQAWRAWRLVRANKVDVIHAHWLIPQGLIAVVLNKLFVVTSHGADLFALKGGLLDALKRFVVRKSSAATVVSTAMRDKLQEIGADTSKVLVLSMGVDITHRFSPDASIARSHDEILFVGRLVEKKGVEYLVRAMPGILRERSSAFLTIAGFGPNEPRLRALASELGLAEKVHFLGARPQAELPALYRRAAVFVAPFVHIASGDQEGLPVALMEAIACGCPILAGDVAGLHDLLGEHINEIVFDPRDTARLSSRILTVLGSPEQAQERALRMSDFVRHRFNWDTIASGYGHALHAVLDAARNIK